MNALSERDQIIDAKNLITLLDIGVDGVDPHTVEIALLAMRAEDHLRDAERALERAGA